MSESTTQQGKFNLGALVDLAIIMVVLVAVKQTFLLFTQLYAGPISTVTAMVVGTFLLRRRGMGWKDLGFRKPENWWKTLGLTVLVFGGYLLAASGGQFVAGLFFENIGTSGRFSHVEGNLTAYLLILVMVWTHGSFFEELLFRAFIINRASTFLGGTLSAGIVAAVFSSIFFGYRHYYYQGMYGAIVTGLIGFVFALFYLWFGKKNILPLIFAHGLVNTLGQTLRFLGIED